mmetsp:Transcript_13554/g.57381  ORF Transcript_13554/g.57381 Transcript_13554/m.57381 type:complete len:291 (+) Transcript_13554:1856-2728(+)
MRMAGSKNTRFVMGQHSGSSMSILSDSCRCRAGGLSEGMSAAVDAGVDVQNMVRVRGRVEGACRCVTELTPIVDFLRGRRLCCWCRDGAFIQCSCELPSHSAGVGVAGRVAGDDRRRGTPRRREDPLGERRGRRARRAAARERDRGGAPVGGILRGAGVASGGDERREHRRRDRDGGGGGRATVSVRAREGRRRRRRVPLRGRASARRVRPPRDQPGQMEQKALDAARAVRGVESGGGRRRGGRRGRRGRRRTPGGVPSDAGSARRRGGRVGAGARGGWRPTRRGARFGG